MLLSARETVKEERKENLMQYLPKEQETTLAEQLEQAALDIQDCSIELNDSIETIQEELEAGTPIDVEPVYREVGMLRMWLDTLEEELEHLPEQQRQHWAHTGY
jgi:hypothetical protein